MDASFSWLVPTLRPGLTVAWVTQGTVTSVLWNGWVVGLVRGSPLRCVLNFVTTPLLSHVPPALSCVLYHAPHPLTRVLCCLWGSESSPWIASTTKCSLKELRPYSEKKNLTLFTSFYKKKYFVEVTSFLSLHSTSVPWGTPYKPYKDDLRWGRSSPLVG